MKKHKGRPAKPGNTMAEYLQCQEKTHERIVRALRKESGAIVVEAQ